MRALGLVCFATFAGGCGSTHVDAQLRDLQERLAASERGRAEAIRKLDDLDNRLFLLSDQVESQKVAMGRRGGAPALPIVTLRPTEPEEQPEEYVVESAPEMAPVPEQRISPKPRKMLKIEGQPAIARVAPAAPAAVAAGAMPSLGVVKLPDRGVPIHTNEAPAAVAPVAVAAPVAGEPVAAYRGAYAKLMGGKAEEAAVEFRAFVKRWPRHDYADNAQYWLGESFYARKDYTSAAPEFQSVVARWPSGNKAPDALLKLGYCLLSLGETSKGRDVLVQVAEHYPRTDAAHLAERRLAELPRTELRPEAMP